MSKAPKKGLNYRLILLTVVFGAIVLIPIFMKVKSSNPDFVVTKVKIAESELVGFKEKVDAMVAKYTVRHDGDMPIVHPPAGSDVYLLAKNYDWGKFTLELEQGEKYRLHLATLDMKHAIVVRELRLMNRIKVGEFKTIEFSPSAAGTFDLICGQFCGSGHAGMVGKIIITENAAVHKPSDGS
ncbi:cytochrome c oxidase subunit 2 [Mariprofundus micogutta]|uniref:Cytochrome c oxidase subunit 2 n=1 Tax=Mariprofundus micogutta TaxID=1921010 RepID=A0A1L8CKJ7_9PROT|nr:hypothetical protein [Mariprofundus micogutta]GAV19389.1 cytochrome c oxidase subunit 2 [Mariprofundus micogutta]